MNQLPKFYPNRGGVRTTALVVLFLSLIFGFACPVSAQVAGAIAGKVYSDLNVNNILDVDELGIFGWRVDLLFGDKIIKSTLSGPGGDYQFSDLAGGDYQIRVKTLENWAMVFGEGLAINLKAGKQAKADLGCYQLNQRNEKTYPLIFSLHTYSVKKLSPTSVQVIWFTNYKATGQVVFGKDSRPADSLKVNRNTFGYQNASAVDFAAKTYHTLTLTNLEPAAKYYFRIISLPDPRQWRGLTGVFSAESNFITDAFSPAENSAGQIKGQEIGKSADGKGGWPPPGKVLSTEITNEELTKIETDLAEQKAQAQADNENNNNRQPAQCAYYIWLLLALNLICVLVAWQRGKNNENNRIRNMWWILLLLVLGPTIFAYPSCRTAVWLFVMLAVNFSYISGFKKKPKSPDLPSDSSGLGGPTKNNPPSPFDNFDDDNIISSG